MPIPDYQGVMLPLLQLVSTEGTIRIRDAKVKIAEVFKLTAEERAKLLPSGNGLVIDNRVGWARTYLKKAGLLHYPQRGVLELTDRGRKILRNPPAMIDVKFLRQFPEFLEFQKSTRSDEIAESNAVVNSEPAGTPEEVLDDAYLSLKKQLLTEMLEKVKICSPTFFESLVVDVLVKMGYGGSRKDAGQAIGQTGDEGIDGIINEDKLGLDVIYIQAKRWQGNVGRPEVQKFAGALQGKRAKKGVLITTSDFTAEAKEFVKNIEAKIVLVSGALLVELLWEYGIGVTSTASYEVKRMDTDYFNE
jgi:restriction system protein